MILPVSFEIAKATQVNGTFDSLYNHSRSLKTRSETGTFKPALNKEIEKTINRKFFLNMRESNNDDAIVKLYK